MKHQAKLQTRCALNGNKSMPYVKYEENRKLNMYMKKRSQEMWRNVLEKLAYTLGTVILKK